MFIDKYADKNTEAYLGGIIVELDINNNKFKNDKQKHSSELLFITTVFLIIVILSTL